MGLERSQALHFCFCFLPKFMRQLNSEQPVSLCSAATFCTCQAIFETFSFHAHFWLDREPREGWDCVSGILTPHPPSPRILRNTNACGIILKVCEECYQRHKGVQDFAFLDNNIGPRLFKPEGAVGTKLLEDLIWKTQQRQKRLKHC